MNEADHKRWLVKCLGRLMPSAVIFRHEDQYTAGIPDISVTLRSTAWLEVKLDRVRGRGLQKENMRRLARACNRAYYVVYSEHETEILDGDDLHVLVHWLYPKAHSDIALFIREQIK